MNPPWLVSRVSRCLLVVMVLGGGTHWAQEPKEKEWPEPFRSFIPEAQKHVVDFPLVPVGTTYGRHKTFTVRLDEKPIIMGGHRFGCVRFVVPAGEAREMVWAFSVPPAWANWYILPATGSMKGFQNWLDADRLYEELPATLACPAHLQTLDADNFKPGETYVLWFHTEQPSPAAATLSGMINFLPPSKGEWKIEDIEKTLDLKTAKMESQATYFKSRGAKALYDKRFFTRDEADSCIDNLLFARRHLKVAGGGWFIATTKGPSDCRLQPELAAIQAAYGDADFALPGRDRRIFDQTAPENETAYYYDHIVFLVQEKRGKARVLNVTSVANDTSAVRPTRDGLTWGDVPLPQLALRIFYRDRKEIARLAYWGDGGAKVLSGELPNDTFQQQDEDGSREELKYLGDGNWEERRTYANGQVRRTATLQAHMYQGITRTFFPDGKPQAEGHYEKGRLDGVLKQWKQTGESRELHFKAGERVRDEDAEAK